MNVLSKHEFESMPKATKDLILKETFEYASNENGTYNSSLQTIFKEHRRIAIAARMASKANIIIDGKKYQGKDIADEYIKSVKEYGYTYYVLTGSSWTNSEVKQLILFVKEENGYVPYARFNIEKPISGSTLPADFNTHFTVPDLIKAFSFKTYLKISDVETENLPKDYLGVTSGIPIYDAAFKGSAPNVLIV